MLQEFQACGVVNVSSYYKELVDLMVSFSSFAS
jgi:hypothetical protein